MLIEIDNSFYKVPDDWKDITLGDFIEVSKYVNKLPKEDAPEHEKLDFYFEYISLFGIPKDVLKYIKLYDADENGLGVVNLFNYLWKFAQVPDIEFKNFDKFKLKGQTYIFNNKGVDLLGNKKPFANLTYLEFEESQAIIKSMENEENPDLNNLSLLCALFYREPIKKRFQWFKKYEISEYNEESLVKRSELFKNSLTMDKVWKCYFFLSSQIAKFNANMGHSLIQEVTKELQNQF